MLLCQNACRNCWYCTAVRSCHLTPRMKSKSLSGKKRVASSPMRECKSRSMEAASRLEKEVMATSERKIPTLELHIALLRNLILECGLPMVEIPPVPDGYPFIACLTHDVDHPSIRRHKLDHTILGFLYRATVGSLISVLQGRQRVRSLLTNWWAALKLPLVQLGLARDFWSEFDRYPKLERGVPSSFFVIPFKDTPGRVEKGLAPKRRASRYGAGDVVGQIQVLKSSGCEIGLHGIDAWIDSYKGLEELEQIRQITGAKVTGVRMHWLYQNEQSPVKLEKAGADYDSTVGYNQN